MAIDYTTLFTRLGKIAKRYNANLSLQGTTLLGAGSGADEILDQYEARRDLVKSVQADFEGFAAAVAGWNGRLKAYADATLADLQAELNAPSASPAVILPLLAERMAADGQTVDANTVSAPAVTADPANVGNGVLVASVLNGDGVPDERVIGETVKVTCTADAGTGAAAGGEPFAVVGFPKTDAANYRPPGSGSTAMVVADAVNLLGTDGAFETFTSNVPGGWTVVAGTAGTHVAQETVNVHRGAGALKLAGTGGPSAVTLTRTFAAGSLRPRTLYALSIWLRKSGTVNSGSTLQVAVKGTGYTAASAFNADPATLATGYAHKSVFFATPASIPSDFRVELTWTSVGSAGASAVVLADDAVVVRPTELGHVSYALFAGATNFVAGDAFDVVTATDGAGVAQSWFARVYDAALPSDNGGGETVANGLFT